MVINRRTGYMRGLEGVMAAIIIGLYLSSVVTTPEPFNWSPIHVSKTSEDTLAALDQANLLDATLLRGDRETFNALMNTMESSLSYTVKASHIPKSRLSAGVLVNDSDTDDLDSSPGTGSVSSDNLPASEYGYRYGHLAELGGDSCPGAGSVCDYQFVLADTNLNGLHRYDLVYMDLNGDGDVEDTNEGPYELHDRFRCTAAISRCDGHLYDIGPLNDTLTLYNATFAARATDPLGGTLLERRASQITVRSVHPGREDLDLFDAIISYGWSLAQLEANRNAVEDVLSDDRMLLVITPVQNAAIESTYLGELGFGYVNNYSVNGAGPFTNRLYSVHGTGNASYIPNNYYLETPIVITSFTSGAGFEEAELTIRDTDITVRRYPGGAISLSTESFAVRHDAGDRVYLQGNTYRISSIDPLRLNPEGEQRFNGFGTERIDADYHATRMEHYRYNTSDYDRSQTWSQEYMTKQLVWGDVVTSTCENVTAGHTPYKIGCFYLGSGSPDPIEMNACLSGLPTPPEYKRFLMINFDEQGLQGDTCTPYIEFVYVDLTDDGDFEDTGEGIYQRGDTIQINGREYSVHPIFDGSGVSITALGPRIVGEIPVSRDAFTGNGRVALIGKTTLGDDDIAIIRSLLAAETQNEHWFTAPRSVGRTSFGYRYMADTGTDTAQTYTLNTVWWRK